MPATIDCFLNGNKRTAVMGLDMFLTANGRVLLMSNADVYVMAKETVEANARGIAADALLRQLSLMVSEESADFEDLRRPELVKRVPGILEFYESARSEREFIRSHPLNNPASQV